MGRISGETPGLLCRTRIEGRPVSAVQYLIIGWKHRLERERERRWTVFGEVREALLCLVYRGEVTRRYPPKGRVDAVELLKPFVSLAKHLPMCALIHVGAQLLDRLPHG